MTEKRAFHCRRCKTPILAVQVRTEKEPADTQFQLLNVACLGCRQPLLRGDLVERDSDRQPKIPAVTN